MLKTKLIFVLFGILLSGVLSAQEGTVSVHAEEEVKQLLSLKKEINQEQNLIRIQIYSGTREEAEDLLSQFEQDFPEVSAKMVYETPSYKIWVGKYRTQIQADRELINIRKKYTSAFSFTPKVTN